AVSVPGAVVSVLPPCTVESGGSIEFGAIQNTAQHLCNVTIRNSNSTPLAISSLAVTGDFQGTQVPQVPFTLAGDQAVTLAVEITPACGKTSLSGALMINEQSYPIVGSGFDPDLPQPSLTFDASSFGSNEQH